jgi:hypothetical protein
MNSGVAVTWVVLSVLTALVLLQVSMSSYHAPVAHNEDKYRDMVTLIMPSFNRDSTIVQTLISTYEGMGIVAEVIIVEFDGGHSLGHKSTVQSPNDLRNRFAPHRFPVKDTALPYCKSVRTPAVLTVDDDCLLSEALISSLYSRLLKAPDALHGIEGRLIQNGEYVATHRPRVKPGGVEVGMLLTWCAMASTKRMIEVEKEFREKYFDFAKPLNGEDIAISRLFRSCWMHEFGWLCWCGLPVYNTEITFLTSEFSLSNKPHFLQERKEVTSKFNAVGLLRNRAIRDRADSMSAPRTVHLLARASETRNTALILGALFYILLTTALLVARRA